MSKRIVLLIVSGGAAVVALAAAAYAFDASRDNLVAKGVTVGGVNVGGLRASAARRRLDRELVKPLSRPIEVVFRDKTYTLTGDRVRLHLDLAGMVGEAVAVSRDGGLPGRLWRAVSGSELDRALAPQVSYSHRAVVRFVAAVAERVNRRPRNATVEPTASSLRPVPARDGVRVIRQKLLASIQRELESQAGERRVRVAVSTVKPKIATSELARTYPSYIVVNRAGFTLLFFKRLKLQTSYRIAVGQQGLETPAGLYHIQGKQVNPSWHVPKRPWAGKLAGRVIPPGPQDPLKARWMGFFGGAGIHGTDAIGSLGSAPSHGCIRMAVPDVIELYDQVAVNTPVFIV